MNNSFSYSKWGRLIFALGVLVGSLLILVTTWASIEATFYGFPRFGNQPMSGLSCPPMLTAAETGSFSVTLTNTTNRIIRPVLRVHISNAGLFRTYTAPTDLAVGETKTQTWDISAADRALDHFIFVKAYTYAAYPLADTEAVCGIFLLDVPLPGGMLIYWGGFVASLAGLLLGLWLIDAGKDHPVSRLNTTQALKAMAVMVAIGLYAGNIGLWPLGVGMLAVLVLTIGVVFMSAASRW